MKTQSAKLHITGLLALLLFAVFAVSILSVLTTGAGVYRRLAERDDTAYTQRTAERYVAAKIRQAGSGDAISVEDFRGVTALTVREEIGGIVFLTRIYCYDGHLRELFSMEGGDLTPADGESILPLAALEGECTDDRLILHLTHEDGTQRELILALRGGEAVPT